MEELTRRKQRAVERILESASLTADLDDDAAKVLLDWGIACAEQIALSTTSFFDDQGNETMDARLRDLRRLMREVNRWVPWRQPMDAEQLAKLLSYAQAIYAGFEPPDHARQQAFLASSIAGSPPETIARLRTFIEGQSPHD
jgi:hypothetical protein